MGKRARIAELERECLELAVMNRDANDRLKAANARIAELDRLALRLSARLARDSLAAQADQQDRQGKVEANMLSEAGVCFYLDTAARQKQREDQAQEAIKRAEANARNWARPVNG